MRACAYDCMCLVLCFIIFFVGNKRLLQQALGLWIIIVALCLGFVMEKGTPEKKTLGSILECVSEMIRWQKVCVSIGSMEPMLAGDAAAVAKERVILTKMEVSQLLM